MRTTSAFLTLTLCLGVYSSATQQVLGSLDPFGNKYQCQNGASPSLECVDASAAPSCACKCSNGTVFNQTLTPTPPTDSDAHMDTCQTEKNECLQREQQMTAKATEAQKAHEDCKRDATNDLNNAKLECLQKEKELSDQLSQCRAEAFHYNGCYVDSKSRIIADKYVLEEKTMTPQRCASICKDYTYYGVQVGTECFCGNSLKGTIKKAAGKECDTKCVGDEGQICGGSWRISLHAKKF